MKENRMNEKASWNTKGHNTVQETKPIGRGQAKWLPLMIAGPILGAALLVVGIMVAPLDAQSYPDRPIRFILPLATGGGVDIVGRMIAPMLAERLGQPVVPENRPGGGGNVGVEYVAKARPDGYTLVIATATIAMSPGLYKKLNYDPIKDLAPISRTSQIQNLLLVHPSVPAKTLKELVAYAKANPGKLNCATSGVGGPGHLAGELLKSLAKIDIVFVPYKSVGTGVIALISGEINMTVCNVSTALPHVQAGKARALAVLSDKRLTSLPNVPTAKEAGVDNWEVALWHGILAPAGTPRDIINRLNAEWVKVAAMPETKERLQKAGVEPLSDTPEQFSEFLKAEIERWTKVIREGNIPRID
jgi:tripartite-type tricarboxylate transporter receptor subunit TctC